MIAYDFNLRTLVSLSWTENTRHHESASLRAGLAVRDGVPLVGATTMIGDAVDVRIGWASSEPAPRLNGTIGQHCMRLYSTRSTTDVSGTTNDR